MTRSQSVIAIIICVGILIGSIGFLHWGFGKYRQLNETGIETEASINRIYKKRTGTINNRISYGFFMEYTFKVKDSITADGGEFVDDKDVQSLRNAGKIMVTYLPNNPKTNQSSESLVWEGHNTIFLFIMYGIMGLCVVGIIVNIKKLCCS